MYKKRSEVGYKPDVLDAAILRKISAGLEDAPLLLFQVDTPKAARKAISKALNSTPGWRTDGATTHDSAGNGIYCLASWGDRITVDVYGYHFRFRILHLDRFGKRDVYSVPLNRVTPPKVLPGLSVSSDEVKLIFAMADATAGFSDFEERLISVKHPLKGTVKGQTDYYASRTVDREALASLLKDQPELITVAAVCADVQMRALKHCRFAPLSLYNFVVPSKWNSTELWLEGTLRSLTFTTHEESNTTGPIVIADSGASAVNTLTKCRGRLAVIKNNGMSACDILVDQIQEYVRQCKCQGYTQPPFIVPPITVTPSALCCPEAADIVLNDNPTPLTAQQSDLLRAAMSSVLQNKEFAAEVYNGWRNAMGKPVAYRMDSASVWRKVIIDRLCTKWFGNDCELAALFTKEEDRQAQLAQERLSHLADALAMLTDVEQYTDQICCQKPGSTDAAVELLRERAFAFWYTPEKGQCSKQKLLVFSKSSLTRFIAQAGCGEELYDAFIKKCRQANILVDSNHSITLGGKTFNGVTFRADKLEELRNTQV